MDDGEHTMKQYRIGDFARRAGVSTRTVRYYDTIGLLSPTAVSEAGQRLYADSDFARLQQILTLKLIGLPLAEIRQVLATPTANLEDSLERQRLALQEKLRQLAVVIQTIEDAQRAMRLTHQLEVTEVISIIRTVAMNLQSDWIEHFLTEDQLEKLRATVAGQTLANQKANGQAWKRLFDDIRTATGRSPAGPAARDLVARWDALITQSAGGDRGIAVALARAYQNIAEPGTGSAPDSEDWSRQLQTAAAFIEAARRALPNQPG